MKDLDVYLMIRTKRSGDAVLAQFQSVNCAISAKNLCFGKSNLLHKENYI